MVILERLNQFIEGDTFTKSHLSSNNIDFDFFEVLHRNVRAISVSYITKTMRSTDDSNISRVLVAD